MNAENSDPLLPLRNVLNSVKCCRDRVRDGESNNTSGTFSLSNFWEILNEAVKAASQEATKLSLIFSKPPLPSEEDCTKIADAFLKSVLALSTVYFWLPKSQGVTLRKQVRDATAEVMEGLVQLLEVLLSAPTQSLSQDQLTSTGGVWAACDQLHQLPTDNRSAVLLVLTSHVRLVKDALDEMEQALAEADDPFGDVLEDDDDEAGARGNQDVYWSECDRQLVSACLGLIKASGASLRKLSVAIRSNGKADTEENVSQLDDVVDAAGEISAIVDDLALSLYPPVNRHTVEQSVCKLAAVLKKVLEISRWSHVCVESDVSWLDFLEGAVEHNLQKVQMLLQESSQAPQ